MKSAIEQDLKRKRLNKLLDDYCMHIVDDPIQRLSDLDLRHRQSLLRPNPNKRNPKTKKTDNKDNH